MADDVVAAAVRGILAGVTGMSDPTDDAQAQPPVPAAGPRPAARTAAHPARGTRRPVPTEAEREAAMAELAPGSATASTSWT